MPLVRLRLADDTAAVPDELDVPAVPTVPDVPSVPAVPATPARLSPTARVVQSSLRTLTALRVQD